jgi:hypothetical protein
MASGVRMTIYARIGSELFLHVLQVRGSVTECGLTDPSELMHDPGTKSLCSYCRNLLALRKRAA